MNARQGPCRCFSNWYGVVSETDPDLARHALAGLRIYEAAPRRTRPKTLPEIARVNGACLRDYGGTGRPPSLSPR